MQNVVTLWANDSPEALALQSLLESRGYRVDHVLTGGHEPIAQIGFQTLSGYGNIQFYLN